MARQFTTINLELKEINNGSLLESFKSYDTGKISTTPSYRVVLENYEFIDIMTFYGTYYDYFDGCLEFISFGYV